MAAHTDRVLAVDLVQIVGVVAFVLFALGASAAQAALKNRVESHIGRVISQVDQWLSRILGDEPRTEQLVDNQLEERLTLPSLEDRAVRVAELLKESGSLLDELTAEMTARAAALEQLRTEAEHAQQLAEIHKEQQEAVAMLLRLELEKQEDQLRAELAKNNRRSFWQGFAVNVGVGLLFFVAGLLVPIGPG
ncbi:hypothetical protein [Actinomadura sp. DC4]|uniref:hypothetical protein n=1 Tax=Actinomadura sp. DC4 TaxID=3055069 RepID=UPI0025AF847D|nr:hypothetical protein [Actinomadura sp. DC4]MDN3356823.1 hypothetical protein [Actinomadura sp. DC4]